MKKFLCILLLLGITDYNHAMKRPIELLDFHEEIHLKSSPRREPRIYETLQNRKETLKFEKNRIFFLIDELIRLRSNMV